MKVKEFLLLEDENEIFRIKAIKETIKGRPFIGDYKSKPFFDLSFQKVTGIRKYYADGNIPFLCSYSLGIGISELLKRPYHDLVYFIKWVEEQIEMIERLESNLNKQDDDENDTNAKLEMAGISEMNIFEELNIIDELADGKLWNWETVQNFSYKKIYTKLLRNKTKDRINRRYQEISSKKK